MYVCVYVCMHVCIYIYIEPRCTSLTLALRSLLLVAAHPTRALQGLWFWPSPSPTEYSLIFVTKIVMFILWYV